ncbi:MAG: stage II sporulation protein M [Bacteroidetes bacterium]|nr:stage II sporulation protein M [Bacteroidota bacterium]
MREAAFVKQNKEKWQLFETLLAQKGGTNPDHLADLFVQLTDDLSFARTFYPDSKTTKYLNTIAAATHQQIYRNKKEKRSRIISFWQYELPMLFRQSHKLLLLSLCIFVLSALIGMVSAANDDTFVRLILGDHYVNETIENIKNGNPLAVYGQTNEFDMFFRIVFNNIRVSFIEFVGGVLFSFGTIASLFYNGVMVGAFQYFFIAEGLFWQSFLVIWIHGTLEISAIVIAGCAGLTVGNSILFPGTYSRLQSFTRGAKQGLKIVIGLIPFFVVAGFLESFVTRHTNMPIVLSAGIILISFAIILGYFVFYPIYLERKIDNGNFSTI